jgi:hypothetical protein
MNGRTIKFVGLSNRRTIELSDYRTRAVGLSNRRTIEPTDYRSVPKQTYRHSVCCNITTHCHITNNVHDSQSIGFGIS